MAAPAGSRPISKRSKAQHIANDTSATSAKPRPMSKLCQSDQLEEYTASMRNYLAIVGDGRSASPKRARMSETESTDSSGSSSGSERERSPEFRWMDLASVRKEHGSVDLAEFAHGNRRMKVRAAKQVHRRPDPGVGKENGHHREHRSASPSLKSMNNKRQVSLAAHNRAHLPDMGRASAEKNCTE